MRLTRNCKIDTKDLTEENKQLVSMLPNYDYARNEFGFAVSDTPRCLDKLGQYEDIEEKHNIKSLDDLDNRLKVLEIINKKGVNFNILPWYFEYSTYEKYVENANGDYDMPPLSDKLLTQEEFNLLKRYYYEIY